MFCGKFGSPESHTLHSHIQQHASTVEGGQNSLQKDCYREVEEDSGSSIHTHENVHYQTIAREVLAEDTSLHLYARIDEATDQ